MGARPAGPRDVLQLKAHALNVHKIHRLDGKGCKRADALAR